MTLDQRLIERAAEHAEFKDEPQLVRTEGLELLVVAEPFLRRAEEASGQLVPSGHTLVSPTGVKIWIFKVPKDGKFGFGKLFNKMVGGGDWRDDVTSFERVDGMMLYRPRPGEDPWYVDN